MDGGGSMIMQERSSNARKVEKHALQYTLSEATPWIADFDQPYQISLEYLTFLTMYGFFQ
jgi:hypothetical protein